MSSRPGRRRLAPLLGGALLVVATLAGCSGDDPTEDTAPTPSVTPTATTTSPVPTPTAPPTAPAVPSPKQGSCYRLTYRQAVSPTSGAAPTSCRGAHTSETYRVGTIDNVVDGHLLAVDSAQVQDDVAERCPATLGEAVGGTLEARRLSMLRSVWFTPSLGQSDKGAAWYRCDVVALAGAESLVDVRGSLDGVLDTDAGRDRYGMCGTTSPDSAAFERVPCSARHTWRAFSVLTLDDGRYPGAAAVDQTGSGCEEAAVDVVDDPLDYQWAYEGPDADEWAAGQTFVRCWAPD